MGGPVPIKEKPDWRYCVLAGLCFYYATALIVATGGYFGVVFVSRQGDWPSSLANCYKLLGRWDGIWYGRIVRDGYSYDPETTSSVVFFPAYPLAAAIVSRTTGVAEETALVVVSHVCLVGIFIVIVVFARTRFGEAPRELTLWMLLAFGLWPISFFFRVAYSESLFVLVVVVMLWGMARCWPPVGVAGIAGLATACRPVGVALALPFVIYLWRRSDSRREFAWQALLLGPVALWGILAYMAYLHAAFGDALAFAKNQQHWSEQEEQVGWGQQLTAALSLEPIWSKYDPTSRAYWARRSAVANPLFSLDFMNPIFLAATLGLVLYGARRRWLNAEEVALGLALLLIPYLMQSHRLMMVSQARYAAACFPAYMVLGQLLARAPAPLSAAVLAIFSVLLGAYSGLFVAGYPFF